MSLLLLKVFPDVYTERSRVVTGLACPGDLTDIECPTRPKLGEINYAVTGVTGYYIRIYMWMLVGQI